MSQGASVLLVCEVVEEQVEWTLAQLCRSCGAAEDLVVELVACGLLDPAGGDPQAWRFGGESLGLTRRALRLMEDLGVNAAGAAVAIELLDRIDQLERARH
jgi:chaperone modulatory protein CbpM